MYRGGPYGPHRGVQAVLCWLMALLRGVETSSHCCMDVSGKQGWPRSVQRSWRVSQVLASGRKGEQMMLWLLSACDGNLGVVSEGGRVPPGSSRRYSAVSWQAVGWKEGTWRPLLRV